MDDRSCLQGQRLQSAAFFAWANRLMLTLGEPATSDAGWGDD